METLRHKRKKVRDKRPKRRSQPDEEKVNDETSRVGHEDLDEFRNTIRGRETWKGERWVFYNNFSHQDLL